MPETATAGLLVEFVKLSVSDEQIHVVDIAPPASPVVKAVTWDELIASLVFLVTSATQVPPTTVQVDSIARTIVLYRG